MEHSDLRDYADKLYDLHKETMQRAHNLSIINFVLSLLGIGLVTGAITVRPESAVGGLVVSSSEDYLVLIIVSVIAITYTYIAGLTIHADRLMRAASTCYADSGRPSTPAASHKLLRYPDLGVVLMIPELTVSRKGWPSFFGWFAGFGIIVATIFVPFGATASLLYRLYGSTVVWVMKALVAVLVLAMSAASYKLISYFVRTELEQNRKQGEVS